MKRRIIVTVLFVMVVSGLVGCISNNTNNQISGISIIAGSDDDPFKNTAWDSKGVTILEFYSNGTVAFGYDETEYTVVKSEEGYVATFDPSNGKLKSMIMTFFIEKENSVEGINTQNVSGHEMKIKMTCMFGTTF